MSRAWRSRGAQSAVCFAAAIAQVVLATVLLTQNAQAAAPSSSVTESVDETRSAFDASGTSTQVDARHVSVTVSQTSNLRGHQLVDVSWTGAHPTSGLASDPNSPLGALQEYPVVLLECRGVDDATLASDQQLSPQTCWTSTPDERLQTDGNSAFPPWRLDAYASDADRNAVVGAPSPRPSACGARPALSERWVPLVGEDGTQYGFGPSGCAGLPPETSTTGNVGVPSNTYYGVTGTDGTGSAKFDVWSADENATLGCSATVACAIVAVPIIGISCDPFGTQVTTQANKAPTTGRQNATTYGATCTHADDYEPGQAVSPSKATTNAVTGALWWSASNWRNRVVFPLTFAVSPSVCDVVSSTQPTDIYGSILMAEASAQWRPTFCTNKNLFPFVHVQTSDDAARNLVSTGAIDAAFSSRAPDDGFSRPVVQAPVSVSGFAISYNIDDAQGRPYTQLRLNARLLAKLLTESYAADSLVRTYDPQIARNPANLTADPEFRALNPGLTQTFDDAQAATLIALSTQSDLVWALTSYINADPEARLWLNGTPDPWGMVVNPNYAGIALPVESWPLLDGFELPSSYTSANNPCLNYSNAPYLSLIANPTGFPLTIVQDVQFATPNGQTVCNGDSSDPTTLKLTTPARQPYGYHFILGLTTLSAARRYSLNTAALQTSVASPGAKFTDASGRSFVSPDDAGLKGAASLLQPDSNTKTWTLPYDSVSTTTWANAYPGTMVTYADVPTSGLDDSTAKRLSTFLTYAATTGQTAGSENGQLPDGYLPLTAANGLSALSTYTRVVAYAVAAQSGDVPALDAPLPTSTPTPKRTTHKPAPRVTHAPPSIVSSPPVPIVPTSVSSSATTSAPATSAAATTVAAAPTVIASPVALATPKVTSSLGGSLVPIAVLIGAVCAFAGGLLLLPRGFTRRAGRALTPRRRR
jgi:hypothetical protein